MADELQVCESCEVDYMYVIEKYHGSIFPGHKKFAVYFFRENGVLPLTVRNSDIIAKIDINGIVPPLSVFQRQKNVADVDMKSRTSKVVFLMALIFLPGKYYFL